MDVNEEIKRRWDELVMEGVLILECKDCQGEVAYTFDLEMLKQEEPELYHAHLDEIDEDMIDLYNQGLVDIDWSNPDIQYTLTAKGERYADTIIEALKG